MVLDSRTLFTKAVRFQLERLDGLRDWQKWAHDEDLDHLRAMGGDEDEGIEFYADEAAVASDTRDLADELAVVGLYRVVEHNTAKLIDQRLGAGTAQARAIYKWNKLRRLLKRQLNVDHKKLPCHDAVNELRCVNNAVKHAGRVTKDLAAFGGWTRGDPLGALGPVYDRLVPHVIEYLEALADSVLA